MRQLQVAAFSLMLLAGAFAALGIRINVTPSIPLGLYRQSGGQVTRGLIAEFCPASMDPAESARYRSFGVACPDRAVPLLKPVVAVEGDQVEFTPGGIAVNGTLLPNTAPRRTDGKGRELHAWPPGRVVLAPGRVVVASIYHPSSYDSRYLGPIPVADVRSTLRPLWVHEAFDPLDHRNANKWLIKR